MEGLRTRKRARLGWDVVPTEAEAVADEAALAAVRSPSPPLRQDDWEGHYVYDVGENLTPRYKILSKMGEGTFGRVLECWDHEKREHVAIKVVRSMQKYRYAAMIEVNVLNSLAKDDKGRLCCVQIQNWFDYRNHICIVFEKLGPSLFDFLKRNKYCPFPVDLVREFGRQLLESVAYMHDLRLVHTDLKPENILLVSSEYVKVPSRKRNLQGDMHFRCLPKSSAIKLIDFGSTAFENQDRSSIVSTRHYRAPEIILGLGWDYSCDIWSVGCILVELCSGGALFQTHENLEHLAMMERVLGQLPGHMIRKVNKYMMLLLLLLGLLISPSPLLSAYAATMPRSVFAHVVVGILGSYTQSQWAQEISNAKASGIDAFALNIGKDSYTQTQLGYAYAAAQADGNFKMFISFDFVYYSLPKDEDLIVQFINRFGSSSAQYKVDGKPLVTTFIGDNQDWSGVKSRTNIFLAPNWADPNSIASNSLVEGGYPWNAWGTVNNRGVPDPYTNMVNEDSYWKSVLGSKLYFAPVSPWFFTHYAPNSYNKNWIFPTEDLYLTRWQNLLTTAPPAIYQLTWNDYSESSYIAPLRSDPNLYPAGASAWTSGMPHDGFRLIQNAFVRAYKAGASSPIISSENIVYWYRTQSKDAQCNDPTGRPDAYQYVSDTLFVVTLLTSPAQLVVKSGTVSSRFNVGAGAVMTKVPIQAGEQRFSLGRNINPVLFGISPRLFTTDCPSNVYNFNVYVGVI